MLRGSCPSLQLSHYEVGVPAYPLGARPARPTHGRGRIVDVDVGDVIRQSGTTGGAVDGRLRLAIGSVFHMLGVLLRINRRLTCTFTSARWTCWITNQIVIPMASPPLLADGGRINLAAARTRTIGELLQGFGGGVVAAPAYHSLRAGRVRPRLRRECSAWRAHPYGVSFGAGCRRRRACPARRPRP
jgi:hypothetical protein